MHTLTLTSLVKLRIGRFNIWIDFATVFSMLALIEVFTSVPPDPVSTVHCRRWVVFSLRHSAD